MLKPPGTERLQPKRDTLLSTSAFNFNLRRYTMEQAVTVEVKLVGFDGDGHLGRGLPTSTSRLNLSRF